MEVAVIFIPSRTGMAQEAKKLPLSSSFTMQTMQDGWQECPSTWHIVGMSMPSNVAAPRTVLPSGTSTGVLSILSLITLIYFHGLYRANLPADVAFYTLLHVDDMQFIGFEGDGIGRASLRAFRTADTILCYTVFYKWQTLPRRAMSVDMGLIFFAEVTQGRQNGIRRRFPQTTEAAFFGGLREFLKANEVIAHSLSVSDLFQQFEHAAGSDTAKGTASAGLVLGEREKIVRDIHHTICLIQYDQSPGAHDGANLGKILKINREVV
jgi:hypothetical protein